MSKKKKNKFYSQPSNSSQTDFHKLTIMGLAFQRAEEKKKKDADGTIPPYNSTGVTTETIKTDKPPFQQHSHAVNRAPSTPVQSPEKPTCVSSQASKKTEIVLPPARVTYDLPKPTAITTRSAPPVNLGIKPVQRQTFNLDIGSFRYDTEKNNKEKSNVNGKSQVHQGQYRYESDVVIGFDFGTSSSKVVIRDFGRQTAYAIPFESLACHGNVYLIPTQIFISDDGSLNLLKGELPFGNLKTTLMDQPWEILFSSTKITDPITSVDLAAAYISLVIRHARSWFLKHNELIYKNTHIHWHVNLGIPSKNYDDEKKKNIFQTITMAAWRLSRHDSIITIADVKKYLKEAADHIKTGGKNIDTEDYEALWIHPDFVNMHPEVIMEVVGYANSPLRANGLHMLVDIGAATLDAATFDIYQDRGDNHFGLLVTKVERYGVIELHNRRMMTLKNSMQKLLKHVNSIDPTVRLPDSAHYEIQMERKDLSENDDKFFKECSDKIGEVIRDTKNSRDPNSSAWASGLPIFLCGGGGRHPRYRDLLENLGSSIASSLINVREFNIMQIPKPNQLDAPELPYSEYDRLAVAYGLSFTADEIGAVIPESKITDIHQKRRTNIYEDRYVSKDMC